MAQHRYSERLALSNRKREQKRRKAATIASLAFAGVLMVGGTIAWITDKTTDVENTFQPAEVTCAVDETISGTTKSKVYVVNTGDVDAYIRAAIVVNWVDAEGNVGPEKPVLNTDYEMVLNQASDPTDVGSWTKGSDGYYYYSAPVEDGETTDDLIAESRPIKAKDGYALQVEILASAVQAEPERAVVDAWGVSVGTVNDVKIISKG